MMKKSVLTCFGITLLLSGCDQLIQNQKQQPQIAQPSVPTKSGSTEEKRFVFPAKSGPFPESSVALDTISGRLCKTYQWKDSNQVPRGLPACSELSASSLQASSAGSTKAYRGFTYKFNGTKWVKGAAATKFNSNMEPEPWSDEQYDPLNLFSKEEKAKRILTVEEIQRVADQFGVSYEEAMEEAKQQGYQVSPSRQNSTVPKP